MEEKLIPLSELETVKQQFENWRKNRKSSKGRIPDELWEKATTLTKTHSVNVVAKTLRLSHADLTKRVAHVKKRPAATKPAQSFIGLEYKTPLMPPECIIELEDPSGAKMKMCFRGETGLDFLALGKAFWANRK